MELIDRFFMPPERSYFLFGPRGTGKSVLTQARYPDALRLDLLEPDVAREYAARPERLRERLAAEPKARSVVIDEVQRVPELLSVVHSLIESRPGVQFVLTGSSARKLKRTGTDLLAGRALLRTLHPLMAAELGRRFSLSAALRHGLVPLVLAAPQPADVLKSYASLYLREEVQMEGLVRNIGAFARFMEVASFSHAQEVNVTNIARECQVERKTVEGYLDVLEDLLLAFRVSVFTRRARRELSAHSRLFLFDAGVFRSLRPAGPLDRPEEIEGAALEGLVAQHLRAWIAYRNNGESLHFWRTRSGVEVDLVVYGPETFAAIEVKSTARVRPEDVRGLRAFGEDYPQSRRVLLYRGKERLKLDEVLCLPCEEFLLALHPAKPMPG